MASLTSFRDLRLWQNAMQLTADVFSLTGDLPNSDKSGIAANLQQVSLTLPVLIAAGHKSGKRAAMHEACQRAAARADELETLLIVAGELYPKVPSNDILDQLQDVRTALEAVTDKLAPEHASGANSTHPTAGPTPSTSHKRRKII